MAMTKVKVGGSVPAVPQATAKSAQVKAMNKGKDKIQTSTPSNAQTLDRKIKGTF